MLSYQLSLILHVAAGSLALAGFWTAALLRKGSPGHRLVGKAYLLCMLAVLLSGVVLTLALVDRGRPVIAMFLAFLLLITAHACWSAWRAIRLRQQRERYFGGVYWTMSVLVLLAGIGVMSLGFRSGALLLQVFGAIGVVAFADAVASFRRAPGNPRWWLREHYSAMIGNGVATHIAFFSIGLRNALPGVDPALQQHLAWFTPLLGAVIAGVWLNRRYGPAAAMRRPASMPAGIH